MRKYSPYLIAVYSGATFALCILWLFALALLNLAAQGGIWVYQHNLFHLIGLI